MELTTFASVGVVLASVGYYFRDLLYRLFDSPVVQQLLNVTMGLTAREGAEIMIQASKELIIILINAFHLILHITGQAAIFVKNVAIVLRSIVNVVYILIVTGNAILQGMIEFPSKAYSWLTTPPPAYGYAIGVLVFLLISGGSLNLVNQFIVPRNYKSARHSGTEEQETPPESSQS
jgi:predicted ferric reductase